MELNGIIGNLETGVDGAGGRYSLCLFVFLCVFVFLLCCFVLFVFLCVCFVCVLRFCVVLSFFYVLSDPHPVDPRFQGRELNRIITNTKT